MANHDIDFPTSRQWGNYYDGRYEFDHVEEAKPVMRVTLRRFGLDESVLWAEFAVNWADALTDRWACKDIMRKEMSNLQARWCIISIDEIEFIEVRHGEHDVIVRAECHCIGLEEIAKRGL